jgi:hypothetical protein
MATSRSPMPSAVLNGQPPVTPVPRGRSPSLPRRSAKREGGIA